MDSLIFFTFITANESAVGDDDPKFYRYIGGIEYRKEIQSEQDEVFSAPTL